MLTEIQKKVLEKYRAEGTKNFTRNEYDRLKTIKERCRHILMHQNNAIKIYLELT